MMEFACGLTTKIKERDNSIDILRAIALFGIILVHVKPWPWLWQLRDFDVPLMVFLSGVVYSKSRDLTLSGGAIILIGIIAKKGLFV